MALLRLEQEKITAAKAQRDSALMHLELGFLSLRLAELGGRSHFDDAAGEFEWVIELQPTLGLSLVWARAGGAGPR